MTREEMERRITAYRRQRGGRHRDGTCGYMASLCPECYAQELALYREFAADKPALPQETPQAYWLRIGGPFGDAWYEAACGATRPRVS